MQQTKRAVSNMMKSPTIFSIDENINYKLSKDEFPLSISSVESKDWKNK